MPRVSDSVSDIVWRVPKLTSLRTSLSMRLGEISATILSICGWWRETSVSGGDAEDAAWALASDQLASRPVKMR
jgi:hypothetical protein